MELIVAYDKDPAGYNMAKYISKDLIKQNEVYHGKFLDLIVVSTPIVFADWINEYNYDGYIFLSKHVSASRILSLTCHTTGILETCTSNEKKTVSIPHQYLQKAYIKELWNSRDNFTDFQITIETTHHGPATLNRPTLFIEIGTTEEQWNNVQLCNLVAKIIIHILPIKKSYPTAVGFGGSHYPIKFTNELINGKYALGTIIPKYQLIYLDRVLLSYILKQNYMAKSVMLDFDNLGKHKKKFLELISNTDMEIIKI